MGKKKEFYEETEHVSREQVLKRDTLMVEGGLNGQIGGQMRNK